MSVIPDRQLTWIDKSEWGPGPWHDEPDKVQWVDPDTKLDCLAVRNPRYGHWCGYVGVPEGHPLFGRSYDEAESLLQGSDIHGGLTFADICDEDDAEHGVCHVLLPGRPDMVWWLGFDAGHGWDLKPGYEPMLRSLGLQRVLPLPDGQQIYRGLAYIQDECAILAGNIRAVES